MKKMLISLMVLLSSMNLLASTTTTSGTADFGVKQTIVFSDNSQITIFYIKDAEGYKDIINLTHG